MEINKITNLLNLEHVNFLISIFKEKNIEIRLVGGCIRDSLLEREVKDIDTAKPLTVSQGGQQVPFELESLKKAIGSNAGCYRCGCNIWWRKIRCWR